jgi:hypothetical protein
MLKEDQQEARPGPEPEVVAKSIAFSCFVKEWAH